MKHLAVTFLFLLFILNFTKQEHEFLRYLQNASPSIIKSPATFLMGTNLISTNGFWKLNLQEDGNLVLKDANEIPIWASGSNGKGTSPYLLKIQEDGNLVIYDSKNSAIWTSDTNGKGTGPFNFSLQGDGNLVLYDSSGKPIFTSNTNYAPVFPSTGCVWLFSECNFKGTKKEYCSDFKTLDSSASSILMPEPSTNCSSTNCLSPVKVFSLQNFTGTQLTISKPNVCLKNINFDKQIASIMFTSKNCNSNQYLSNGQCLDCPSKCTKCEGPTKCTSCESSLSVNSSTGLCGISCPNGQFDNNGSCANCSSNCVTCSSFNKCTSCKGSLRINSLQMCEPDCPPSQYVLKENCVDCPSSCLTCINDKMCSSCYGNSILSPQYKCELSCAKNEFRTSLGECAKCPITCGNCMDSNTCVGCINGYVLYQGKCISECPPGTLKNKGNCYAIVQCTSGWFQDFNNSGECSKCGDNCLKCVSQTACLQCDGNFNLLGFDSTTKKYYEVNAESAAGLDGPSASFGVKYGQESENSIKIGSSSCTTPDQMLLMQGFQAKSDNGMIIGIVVGVVGFFAFTIFIFLAFKNKWLCWKSDPETAEVQETKRSGKEIQNQDDKPDYAQPGEDPAKALEIDEKK